MRTRKWPKRLPCKYFYDLRGSELFNQICELEEYYLTRVELEIMEHFALEMAQQIDETVRLVEFGNSASVKTRLLLDHLKNPVAYVPVDISRDHLFDVCSDLQDDYPNVEVLPVVADFSHPSRFPTRSNRRRTPRFTFLDQRSATLKNMKLCDYYETSPRYVEPAEDS